MDNFANYTPGLTSPATRHLPIVPSDSEDLPFVPRTIKCKVAGTLMVRDVHGTEDDYPMEVGEEFNLRVVRVLATGTTGTYMAWE